jgi:hypothetical protein
MFSVGFVAFAGAFLFAVLYLLVRQLRWVLYWGTNDPAYFPRERRAFFVPLCAMMGFFLGGLAEPGVLQAYACYQFGTFTLPCIVQGI